MAHAATHPFLCLNRVHAPTKSAHPLENPTPFSNLVEMLSILLIPAALCFSFGRAVGSRRQGVTIFAAMFALLVLGMGIIGFSEQAGTAQLAQNGAVLLEAGDMQPGGNMEYKLLAVLARNSGKVLTYKYLLRQLWGSALESDMASLRVFMVSLRKKLAKSSGRQYLQTHVGIGYRLI